jgi:predicted acyl esterase
LQPDHSGNDDASFRFFDEVLLGKAPAVADPPVAVQQAPDLRWRSEKQWPPADARELGMPVRPGTYLDTAGNTSGDAVWEAVTSDFLPGQTIPIDKDPLTARGTWTFTQPLSSQVHLSGNPQLHVDASGLPNAHVVSLLYDVSPDGSALLITRGASLLANGSVDITLNPQDWVIARGHRIGLLLSGADDSWYFPQGNSGQMVQVHAGHLDIPALTHVRKKFLNYPAGERFAQVKHPIHVDQTTIDNGTEALQ